MNDPSPTEPESRATDDKPRPMDRALHDGRRLRGQVWSALQPRFHQAAVNLRVWLPPLSNRGLQARRVVYWAREHQRGLTWEVVLPEQCWKCGGRPAPHRHTTQRTLRSFESPMAIVGGTVAITAVCMIWALLFGSGMALLIGVLGIGAGVGFLLFKSWTEEVRIAMFSCTEHALDVQFPETVSDQGELFLFMPTPALAEAAEADLAELRRSAAQSKGRHGGGDGPRSESWEPSSSFDRREPFVPPRRPELPPIKLVDDEPSQEDEPRDS